MTREQVVRMLDVIQQKLELVRRGIGPEMTETGWAAEQAVERMRLRLLELGAPPADDYGMRPADFRIGREFMMSGQVWRCTDVGLRSVAAIQIEAGRAADWYTGPPYAVVERVIDENDLLACSPLPQA